MSNKLIVVRGINAGQDCLVASCWAYRNNGYGGRKTVVLSRVIGLWGGPDL